MLAAAQQIPILPIVLGIVVLIGLGLLALLIYRGYEGLARRSLRRKYAGLEVHEVRQPGDVILTYHTYHGFLVWFTQTTHQMSLPPNDARKLLGRLLRFNLAWGLCTYGALFIPPLAIANYIAQRRSITDQEADVALALMDHQTIDAGSAPLPASDGNPYASPKARIGFNKASPPLYRRIIGWTCAGFCVLFTATTIRFLWARELEGVIGGLFVSALFAWVAWDWIREKNQD